MPALPQPLHQTVAGIFAAWEAAAGDGLRPHIGASEIGDDCLRRRWYTFRWSEQIKWTGQMLRVFDHGKREEDRVESDLKRIGCEVHTADESGVQWTVNAHAGHFGGSLDGAVRWLPEAPKTWHVLEIKTANDKSWKALAKDGLKKAQYRHWAQVQVYMHLTGMTRAAYFSVNKNDDSIYMERVEHDKDGAEALLERALSVITSAEPPPRLSEDPDWWQCRGCHFHGICHGTDAPLVNCRTCAHSTPVLDGKHGEWRCERGHSLIIDLPKNGCADHRYIPVLLEKFAEPVDASDNSVEYRNTTTGLRFSNGELSSTEIRACKDKAMLGQERVDPTLRQLREDFGATYAG